MKTRIKTVNLFYFLTILLVCSCGHKSEINDKLTNIFKNQKEFTYSLTKEGDYYVVNLNGQTDNHNKIISIESNVKEQLMNFDHINVINNIELVTPCDKWIGFFKASHQEQTIFDWNPVLITTEITISKSNTEGYLMVRIDKSSSGSYDGSHEYNQGVCMNDHIRFISKNSRYPNTDVYITEGTIRYVSFDKGGEDIFYR